MAGYLINCTPSKLLKGNMITICLRINFVRVVFPACLWVIHLERKGGGYMIFRIKSSLLLVI